MSTNKTLLNQRSIDVFKTIIDTFIETGEPVGSRTISQKLKDPLSPATIRNVMADLEDAGLLFAPHISAGRLPTESGLKFFVEGLLEIGDLSDIDRQEIERRCSFESQGIDTVLEQATNLLSGLSSCAGVVLTPKMQASLKHIEFVYLSSSRVLAILVTMDGFIENRILELPDGITVDILKEASNYLSAKIYGKTLEQAKSIIEEELRQEKTYLNNLASKVVEMGLGVWSQGEGKGNLIIKGQSHLLENIHEIQDLEKIRQLFQILDTKESLVELIDRSIKADGVQIYIGSENSSFQLSGCSMIVSPFQNSENKIIGAIGVIGPSRMNYGKVIPLVDYTAKMVSKILR